MSLSPTPHQVARVSQAETFAKEIMDGLFDAVANNEYGSTKISVSAGIVEIFFSDGTSVNFTEPLVEGKPSSQGPPPIP